MPFACPGNAAATSAMQCIGCMHQHRRYRAVDGSITFVSCSHPLFEKPTEERALLARICLRDAARGDCLQFEAIVMHPGGYIAEDLIPPAPGSGRDSGDDVPAPTRILSGAQGPAHPVPPPARASGPLPIASAVLAPRL